MSVFRKLHFTLFVLFLPLSSSKIGNPPPPTPPHIPSFLLKDSLKKGKKIRASQLKRISKVNPHGYKSNLFV